MSTMHKSLACILLLFVLYAVCDVEGRYLPTRSDNTRYEHIKEVLRALMELSEPDGRTSRQGYGPYDEVLRAKREVIPSQQQQLPASPVNT